MNNTTIEVTNNEPKAFGNYRSKWEENNPDKFIKIDEYLKTEPELLIAKCTWSPNCSNKDLIDYVDNSTNNLGGSVELVIENKNGTESGIVVVYNDW